MVRPPDAIRFIDPRQHPLQRFPPPVHIEQITADGKRYDTSHSAHLPARIRDLTIRYTALSLAAPEKIHFRFKLEGQDEDWREVVDERQVQYSNLPPKKYRFRVIASNNSGVWNETGDTLEFSVAPAYYQTNFFRAACVAAFFMIVWGLYRYRLHQIKWGFNVQLEARVEKRTRIARELHDTLWQKLQAALSRISGGAEFFSKGRSRGIPNAGRRHPRGTRGDRRRPGCDPRFAPHSRSTSSFGKSVQDSRGGTREF